MTSIAGQECAATLFAVDLSFAAVVETLMRELDLTVEEAVRATRAAPRVAVLR